MNRYLQMAVSCVAAVLTSQAPGEAGAQVAEAAVRPIATPGFHLPSLGGSLVYALNASESVGYSSSNQGFYNRGNPAVSSNFSGDLAYLSPSMTHPFSAIYSGAVLAGNDNQPTTVVQNLALSQVLETRLFDFTVTDSVSYLPSTATIGLSGVPGLGDLGVDPVSTGPVTGQGVLTGYAPRVSNSSIASVTWRLTGKTSAQGSGSFVMQRFTGDDQGLIDSNQAAGSLGASHRLDARTSVNGTFTFSKITYSPDVSASAFNVQGINFGCTRQISRSLAVDASVGPQWVETSAQGDRTALDLAVDADLHFQSRMTTASASYVRGANNGFGVIGGSFSNSIAGNARRTFSRVWNVAVTVNYSRTSNQAALGLPYFSLGTLVGGLQVSRAVTRSISTYASYSAQHQSTSGIADTSGAFRGLFQGVSFGVTYSPRTLSFGAR